MKLFEDTGIIELRAIWLNNPFAHLMLHGKIETRWKPTKVRGQVLLCSCKKPYDSNTVLTIAGFDQFDRIHTIVKPNEYINGHALCLGELVHCRPMEIADEDRCYVEYQPGLWCWIFKDVKPIEPFELKGKQGWMKLSSAVPEQKLIIDKIKIIDYDK